MSDLKSKLKDINVLQKDQIEKMLKQFERAQNRLNKEVEK